MVKKVYAIEVSENGWMDNCPDWEGVFFGEAAKMPGAVGVPEYALIVVGAENRDKILRVLRATGDWENEDGEERPTYTWRKATHTENFLVRDAIDKFFGGRE